MGLPPATPAPSRFLISKRPSTQRSQNHTPNQQYPQRSSQFHATPRFATSTPRPSSTQAGGAFTTPALAIKSRVPRYRSTQDIIDDSSPVSPEEGSPSASPTTRTTLPEPIEFDSSLVPQSLSPEVEGRSPKRRRISIASSEPETDPVVHSQQSQESDLGSLPDAPDDHIVSYHSDVDDADDDAFDDGNASISPTHSIPSSPRHHHPSPTPKPFESPEPDNSEDDFEPDASETPKLTTSIKKPAFRPGPRFKPTSPPDRTFPSLPDAAYLTADIFSPQRRGGANKYLPGGLAAELRDWLVDVKGGVDGEGEVQSTSAALGFDAGGSGVVRVVVDEVERGGVGMTLVCGRVVVNGGTEVARVRVILAGEGNMERLGGGGGGGNRGLVGPGAVVAVVPPAWDVELDGQWAVAYRWEVVKGGGG